MKNGLIHSKRIEIGRCLIVLYWKEKPEFKLTKINLFAKAKIDYKEEMIPDGCHKEHKKIRELKDSIVNYFKEKKPLIFSLQDFDFSECSGFSKKVLTTLWGIPFGRITTYKMLAELSGFPGACRAVGSVMAKNSFPLLIPCHRVIKSDLSIGEFGPGRELKKILLCHETSKNAIDEYTLKNKSLLM